MSVPETVTETARPWRLVAAVAVIAVLAVASAALAWKVWQASAEDESRRAGLAAAREFAVTVTTYDHRHLDQDFDAVLSASTGGFARQYRAASKELRPLIVSARSRAKGTVIRVGASSVARDRVVALVFVDQEIVNGDAKKPRVDRSRMTITLVHQHGRWLVSELRLE